MQVSITHRYFTQKSYHNMNVLDQEEIEWKHIRLLCPEQNIVGQILDYLCDKKQSSTHFLGRWRRYKSFYLGSNNCRTEEAKEDEGANGSVLGVGKTVQDCIGNLPIV